MGASEDETHAEIEEARAGCSRSVNGHGNRSPSDLLAQIPPETRADRYGKGGVVAELEHEVAGLLGKPAVVFFPTGTMAQQVALRVHADRRGRRAVVWHPACHLDWHEGRGYQWLHDLVGVPVGDIRQPLTLSSLTSVAERPAAPLPLPQRDLGGVLPEWNDLVAMTDWAHQHGAATHLDGSPHLGGGSRIRALRGRGRQHIRYGVRVVLQRHRCYFGMLCGGSRGCDRGGRGVAHPSWRKGLRIVALRCFRLGGVAAAARLAGMPEYLEHARRIASALSELDSVRILPDPPHTSMMHLQLRLTKDELLERGLAIAKAETIWTFAEPFAVDNPEELRVELSVGDATLGFSAPKRSTVFSIVSCRPPKPGSTDWWRAIPCGALDATRLGSDSREGARGSAGTTTARGGIRRWGVGWRVVIEVAWWVAASVAPDGLR